MQSFKAGLKNELSLLLYRKKTVAFLLFSAVLPVLAAVSLRSLQPYLGLSAVSESFSVEMLGLYTLFWIPLFVFLAAADLFPSEISARTLKLSLLRPITRLKVYLAKTAAIALGIGALLVVLGLVTALCGLFAGTPGNGSDWSRSAAAFFAAFWSMLALAAFFIFIAQFFKTASGALVFSLILYAVMKILPFFIPMFSAFSPVSYTDWHTLWLSSAVSGGKLVLTSMFLASSCVVFLSLGYAKFERREV